MSDGSLAQGVKNEKCNLVILTDDKGATYRCQAVRLSRRWVSSHEGFASIRCGDVDRSHVWGVTGQGSGTRTQEWGGEHRGILDRHERNAFRALRQIACHPCRLS